MKLILILIIVILFSFISALFSLKYKLEKAEKEKVKKELKDLKDEKSKKELIVQELSSADKKIFTKIFRKKINYFSQFKKIKGYSFYYKRNEVNLAGINKEYDIINVELKKLKLNNDMFFNVSIRSWKKESDYKKGAKPDNEVIDLLSKKEFFSSQIILALSKFFINPNSIKNGKTNKLGIENS